MLDVKASLRKRRIVIELCELLIDNYNWHASFAATVAQCGNDNVINISPRLGTRRKNKSK